MIAAAQTDRDIISTLHFKMKRLLIVYYEFRRIKKYIL